MTTSFPERLIFTDVETTGLGPKDRVVSIGLVTVDFGFDGPTGATCEHLLFNPKRPCSDRAYQVHGWSDWDLERQPPFRDYAHYLLPAFERPHLVWAHNARFDEEFIRREFELAGIRLPRRQFKCTKELWEQKRGGWLPLDAAMREIGVIRGGLHNALEDAWHAMLIWLELRGVDLRRIPTSPNDGMTPTNLDAGLVAA